MLRKIIKFGFIFIVFMVGSVLFGVAQNIGSGVLPLAIISIGMFAAIGAIWKYNPASKEITLNKED